MRWSVRLGLFFLLLTSFRSLEAQVSIGESLDDIRYDEPKSYTLAAPVTFRTKENSTLDQGILRMLCALNEGEQLIVPGEKISSAIEALWKQGLFSSIEVRATKIENGRIWLEVWLEELPRLKRYTFRGVRRNEADDIREQLKLIEGKPINENLIVSIKNTTLHFFRDKGYMDAEVKIDNLSKRDTMLIEVVKNRRIKIHKINITGNNSVSSRKLKKKMKNTRENPWWSIFTSSKFLEDNYHDDKQKLLGHYAELGFKDVRIVADSIYRHDKKHININIQIEEGSRYYLRNITWVGNTKYTTRELSAVLGVRKGDIYNQANLEANLFMNQAETDVSSLYMNDGYLFFRVTPVESIIGKDSVDIEMRIYEGKQATINRVTVVGNEKTNDHVILRELRTRPGQLFRRSDIIRTQRELMALGYFNPEKLGVSPIPDPVNGTVDIEYRVEEKPSDQLQLSGGWGAGRLIGNLGLSFNNFSAKKMFRKGAWQPLPAGDGQRLSINASSTGPTFQSYNLSFTEPWLGGKRPNSLTVTLYHSIFGNGLPRADPNRSITKNTGLILGFGRRLRWPDDLFSLQHSLSYQYYELQNSSAFELSTGFANNLSLTNSLSRNSVDDPIYPRTGSSLSLSLQFTFPYSLLKGRTADDYQTIAQRYKWVEFYKWKFDAQWFTRLTNSKSHPLVLMTRANFGLVGSYNSIKGLSPFERFRFGGTGLNGLTFGAQLLGADIVGLRGYPDASVSGSVANGLDAPLYNRLTMELRFPVSLNPSATVFGIGFLEGGNSWMKVRDFDPFNLKRSAGLGVRVFLPMFGLLGLDWAVPFDKVSPSYQVQKSYFHFIIGQNFN
jgi:outer membrane protein insertion porin family